MMKFEMTPRRRMDAAFWLGIFQAIISMTLVHSFQDGSEFGVAAYILLITAWFAIGILYIKNSLDFSRETLWMTIKNPAKVTLEDVATSQPKANIGGTPPSRGSRPPPPPKPPSNGGNRSGSAF